MSDPFSILGVSRDATADQVRRAYREKALRLHPDRAGGDLARMAELNAAHDAVQSALSNGARSSQPPVRSSARPDAPPRRNTGGDRDRLMALAKAFRGVTLFLGGLPSRIELAFARLEGDPYDLEEAGRFTLLSAELRLRLSKVMYDLSRQESPGSLHGHMGRVEQGLRQIEDALDSWERYHAYLDLDALVEGREILVAAMDWLDEVVPLAEAALEEVLGMEVRR